MAVLAAPDGGVGVQVLRLQGLGQATGLHKLPGQSDVLLVDHAKKEPKRNG